MYERNYYAEEAFISRPRPTLYSTRGIRRAAGPNSTAVAAATPSTMTESRVTTHPTTVRAPPSLSAPEGLGVVRALVPVGPRGEAYGAPPA